MAKSRKDDRGRALRKGEVQRASDKRYMYTYTDPLGRRKFIYANDLTELREKEKKLVKDRFVDGLSQMQTAQKLGVSQMFVSRSERKVLAKLKERLRGVDV